MHDLEPFWNWRERYTAEDDERSPFHGTVHSEFHFTDAVYDHYIHPQWDNFGSSTLYLKVLYADYAEGFTVIELIGEWNDLLHNDIMLLKRNILEHQMAHGITRFILLGENVLNMHPSDDEYYAEWFDELEDAGGWAALIGFREHVLQDLGNADLDHYFISGGDLDRIPWRTLTPDALLQRVEKQVRKRLG